jgi:hypothetical protein
MNSNEWQLTKAKTLYGAKRVAQQRCIFIGQTIRVGIAEENDIREIAYRAADPINMRKTGHWVDVH